ncbi:DedA family protein [Bacillus tianshenii]|uniref:DedA family protein n=1 Tax=Sutcliffiella tianshenii TaxID=1463404 RepID=UPI001CD30726|nr:DedA family protein [Bacillus tianshenii]MCA1321194.1 DedA family protein [Bacillus tianshenii]
MSILEAFKSLSYFGVVLALTFEFIPAEIVLPLVGYWVYEGDMNLAFAILAGSIGGVTGPLTLYALGRFGGRPLIEKYGKYFLIREKEMMAAERFFDQYGPGIAFLGRFIPGVRTAISIPCGMAKMNIWIFICYTFLAMIPITAAYIYAGYKLGPHWAEAAAAVSLYMKPLVAVILGGILGVFLIKLRKRRKIKNWNKSVL